MPGGQRDIQRHRVGTNSQFPLKLAEVFGEFSQLIPQKGLAKLERGRERECLVPDFKV